MWFRDCHCIVVLAGENPFSFHRENLLRINLVTLTDEGFTSLLLRWANLSIRVQRIRTQSLNFSGPKRKRKPRWDTTYLLFFRGSFAVRFSLLMTSFQSFFWSFFAFSSLFALRLIFAFLLMHCLFLFRVPLFWRPFGVLSNFLVRFSRFALHLLLLAFFGRTVSFYPAYLH